MQKLFVILIMLMKPPIKIAKKCIKNLYAVTDSMGATGLNDGIYNFLELILKKK